MNLYLFVLPLYWRHLQRTESLVEVTLGLVLAGLITSHLTSEPLSVGFTLNLPLAWVMAGLCSIREATILPA